MSVFGIQTLLLFRFELYLNGRIFEHILTTLKY